MTFCLKFQADYIKWHIHEVWEQSNWNYFFFISTAAITVSFYWALLAKEGQGRNQVHAQHELQSLLSAHKWIKKTMRKASSRSFFTLFLGRHAKYRFFFVMWSDNVTSPVFVKHIKKQHVTHPSYVAVLRYKSCSRCCTSPELVCGLICMLESLLLLISMTWAECSCDCRSCKLLLLTDHSNLC